MKTNNTISRVIQISRALFYFGAIYFVLWHKFVNLYEYAPAYGDDWRRIPLWKPYEIVNYGRVLGIQLHNWYGWNYKIDDSVYVDESVTNREIIALAKLTDIQSFGIESNVFYGVRNVLGRPGYYGKRYFLFSTNRVETLYFQEESKFLEECKKYGVDGTVLSDFGSYWKEYWSNKVSYDLIKIIINDFKEGFSLNELFILWVLIFLCYRRVRQLFIKRVDEGIKQVDYTFFNEMLSKGCPYYKDYSHFPYVYYKLCQSCAEEKTIESEIQCCRKSEIVKKSNN